MQKDLLDEEGGGGGGAHLKNPFSISYKLIAEDKFITHIFNQYLSNVKITLGDNLRARPSILSRGKYCFLCNFYFSHCSGQF